MKRVAVQHVSCDYCGLPITATAPSGGPSDSAHGASYCCFGCRFAAAIAQEKGEAAQVRWRLTQLGLAIFFTMNVMVFTLVLWTQDIRRRHIARSGALGRTNVGGFVQPCPIASGGSVYRVECRPYGAATSAYKTGAWRFRDSTVRRNKRLFGKRPLDG